jgi:hypothetical protein
MLKGMTFYCYQIEFNFFFFFFINVWGIKIWNIVKLIENSNNYIKLLVE